MAAYAQDNRQKLAPVVKWPNGFYASSGVSNGYNGHQNGYFNLGYYYQQNYISEGTPDLMFCPTTEKYPTAYSSKLNFNGFNGGWLQVSSYTVRYSSEGWDPNASVAANEAEGEWFHNGDNTKGYDWRFSVNLERAMPNKCLLADVVLLASYYDMKAHDGRINRLYADGSVATRDYLSSPLLASDPYMNNPIHARYYDDNR